MAEDTVSKLVDLALKNNSYDVLIHICENEELDRLVRVFCLFSLSLSHSHRRRANDDRQRLRNTSSVMRIFSLHYFYHTY